MSKINVHVRSETGVNAVRKPVRARAEERDLHNREQRSKILNKTIGVRLPVVENYAFKLTATPEPTDTDTKIWMDNTDKKYAVES